jgi:hypothetical protein
MVIMAIKELISMNKRIEQKCVYLKKTFMIIERTHNEIIFRFPKSMNFDDLQDITDFFEYKELTQKTKVSQKDVDDLVKIIKKGRWERTKQQLNK